MPASCQRPMAVASRSCPCSPAAHAAHAARGSSTSCSPLPYASHAPRTVPLQASERWWALLLREETLGRLVWILENTLASPLLERA